LARSKANTRTPTKRSSTAQPNARPKRSASNAGPKPVTVEEFDAEIEKLDLRAPLALAVSGGADSLALMFLAADWAKRHRAPAPSAITVDHGLRDGSAKEAATVAAWARAAKVPHTILTWQGKKPAQNIQAAARDARYRLIGHHMRAKGVNVLLTGHTEDDQAETFLLRVARGSGLDGLSGMAPIAPLPIAEHADLKIARPLLAFAHDRLVATLTARKQEWIADPSNENDRFARVQIRGLMPALDEAGVTRGRIAAAATHLRRAREAIDTAVATLIASAVELSPCGYALVSAWRFKEAPSEIALRALSRLVEAMGGGEYPPRFEQTDAALAWFNSTGSAPRGRTFGGCRLERRPDGRVLIAREESALERDTPPEPLKPGETVLWDRRFLITLSQTASAATLELRHLGTKGVKAVGKSAVLPPVEPHLIAATTPGLWRAGRLVAAPLLGFHADGVAVSARFVGLSRV
jgi:tRNA(Ile)-lysidine synthase